MSEPNPTFEQMVNELDEVVSKLEDGAISLDDALAHYEQGVKLLRSCYDRLKSAEQKIQQLTGIDEHGQPILQPLEAPAREDSEPTAARKSRKKSIDE